MAITIMLWTITVRYENGELSGQCETMYALGDKIREIVNSRYELPNAETFGDIVEIVIK